METTVKNCSCPFPYFLLVSTFVKQFIKLLKNCITGIKYNLTWESSYFKSLRSSSLFIYPILWDLFCVMNLVHIFSARCLRLKFFKSKFPEIFAYFWQVIKSFFAIIHLHYIELKTCFNVKKFVILSWKYWTFKTYIRKISICYHLSFVVINSIYLFLRVRISFWAD